MDFNNNENDWKNEAPLLASLERKNPFLVPDKYFIDTNSFINSQLIIGSDKALGFAIPPDYFEHLTQHINDRIAISDLNINAETAGFVLPADYFETLSNRIENSLAQEKVIAKVVTLRRNKSWINYAAAACVTIALATGFYFNQEANTINKQLDQIPDQEIVNYLQQHSDTGDFPIIVDNLDNVDLSSSQKQEISSEEMQDYLEITK